ncbi:unnamed protein product, partial [Brenthis ino]
MTGATSRRGEDQPWCADRNRGAVSTEKTDRQGICRLELQALVVDTRRQPAEQAGRTMTATTSRRGEHQPWGADRTAPQCPLRRLIGRECADWNHGLTP